MRTSSIIALAVLVSLLAGIALGEYFPLGWSSLASRSTTTTVTTSTRSSNSTICIVSAQSNGVLLHLINNSGPIRGIRVYSYAVGLCDDERQFLYNPQNTTNSSGWADLRYGFFGNYYVAFSIGLFNYNITVPVQPISTTIATYDTNSGNLTIRFVHWV